MEQSQVNARERIPVPPDRNTLWKPPSDLRQPLSPFQEDFILSVCPPGSRIISAHFHRSVRLPCPIWVRVVLPSTEEQVLILRMDYTLHGVVRESAVLPILAKYAFLCQLSSLDLLLIQLNQMQDQ